MSKLITFSFENCSVRTLGSSESPLFVAVDIISALGFKDTINPIKRHVDPEDLIKSEITDNLGRIQTVNCVNESGLYALIFGSKLEKAKVFKRWVTSEVLPTIRKTGRYELPRDTLTTEEQYEVRKAVKLRAKNSAIHYQTIYNAMYEYFKVASYKDLTRAQLQNALAFIRTSDIKPQLPPVDIPEGALVLEKSDAKRIANFVYFWKYLFRSDLELIHELLKRLDSPKASHFHDAVNELNLSLLEGTLEKYGYSVTQMPCYKHHNSLTNAPRN